MSKLFKILLPTGYAHRVIDGSEKEKLIDGLEVSEQKVYSDADSVLDSMLPDNSSFTASDATRMEQMLGMITNASVSLSDRKYAIVRKLNHPGTILARQSRMYIESQLRLAGFNVYVHESQASIESVMGLGQSVQLGDAQLGDAQLGMTMYVNKIANSLKASEDRSFVEDVNNKNTFYIGGLTFGSVANMDISREVEFRKLVLTLKPLNTVCYALINYI